MPHVNPSAIDWRENEGGALVAFEDSKALDTENDIYFNGLQFSEGPLVIIGIGSGFIIDKILKTNPNSKIIAIECRDGLMARQRKKYPNVEFHLLQSWQDFENCPEVEYWMRPEVQKILNRPALGQQSQFFQELFYYLNLRTRKSIEKIVKLHSSIDDRWLVNLSQFIQAKPDRVLNFSQSHTLILQELVK